MKYRLMAPENEGSGASGGSVEPAQTEVTEVVTPESPAGDAADGGDKAPSEAVTEVDPAGAQTPAFAPNFKVKVMDQELDIPEGFRTLIKDAKTQKEVTEIFEKAYGLEHHKKKTHEPLVQNHRQLVDHVKGLDAGMSKLQQLSADPKTFREFVDFWKIDKKVLYDFVAQELRFEELPENQQREILDQRRKEREAGQHRVDADGYKERWLQSEAQNRMLQLDTAISRQDIAEVASKFDARAGKPGSFKQEVIYRGILHSQATGKDLSIDEAVRQVMSVLGFDEQADGAGQPAAPQVVATVPQRKLPVIPAVGAGNGASPVKRAVNSTDDLRKLYQDKYGSKQVN